MFYQFNLKLTFFRLFDGKMRACILLSPKETEQFRKFVILLYLHKSHVKLITKYQYQSVNYSMFEYCWSKIYSIEF